MNLLSIHKIYQIFSLGGHSIKVRKEKLIINHDYNLIFDCTTIIYLYY